MVLQAFAQQTQLITTIAIATAVAAVGIGYAYYLKKKKDSIPQEWTKVGKVTQLCLYPLKSGRRRELQSVECTPRGFHLVENGIELRDRCFVVYGQGEIKTARGLPKLVLIETFTNAKGEVVFTAPGQDQLVVKVPNIKQSKPAKVLLFGKENLETFDCGDEAGRWLSEYVLDKPSGLNLGYHSGDNYDRNFIKGMPKYATAYPLLNTQNIVLYQDTAAYMLMNQASVDELNRKVGTNVSNANFFRPSILIDGPKPYAEEAWEWIKIGDTVFRNVKPCTRCVFTTLNPESGIFNKGREPLNTLINTNNLKDPAHIKAEGKMGVMGINLNGEILGKVSVGDAVYVA